VGRTLLSGVFDVDFDLLIGDVRSFSI